MIAQLRPYLPFDDAETTESYVRRLSQFHTGRDGPSLLKDFGIDHRAFLAGSHEVIAKLAEISGTTVDVLIAGTFQHRARYREFRNEACSVSFLRPEGAAICPECLKSDASKGVSWMLKGSVAWRLRSLQTCTLHSCRLIAPEGSSGTRDGHAASMTLDSIRNLVSEPQEPTALEVNISNRLRGTATEAGDWLDQQTIEQSAKVCEMIGATLQHGLKFHPKMLSAEDWRQAGACGFDIARRGEDAVSEALSSIAALSTTTAGQAGPKAVYGRLYEWIAYGSQVVDFGPIRGLLREHILNTIVIEPGEILLAEPVADRRLHSVHSLSIKTGLHRKRLRKVMVQAGYASADSWDLAAHRLVFDVAKAETLCADIVDGLSLHLVPEFIGCSRNQAECLYRENLISPIITTDASNRIGKLTFARRDLLSFLKTIGQLSEIKGDPAELIDMVSATKRTGRSTGDIMTRILDGNLKAVRRAGDPAVNAIRFDLRDLDPIRTRKPKHLS
ncbi:TniQ protein [Monaibacterium marinum]|uniref:TniQ protein n=1 Tax=Pontivivens marinum TaxID=1690039 RepID=A0A2C9CQB4_9RHOB|nr:TniQ family protein [Monaibacterium marinum]SOH93731.1 TniQ protein [Monaibacterium marinum]